ncbi:MAG: HigA family addiction module antidote protein [Treponema sp.]|jgi:addiction module HigA family antidote|nr:HigA family addiction module antidote protein [Treponema sp.]
MTNQKTPGSLLQSMVVKHQLNYNRLGKALGLSSSLMNMIAADRAPITTAVALRLSKFFKTTPQFWISCQSEYNLALAGKDKKLTADLKQITTVDKYSYERKPHKVRQPASRTGSAKTAKAGTGKAKRKAAAAKKPGSPARAKTAAKAR